MSRTSWIAIDATIVECYRAWGEPLQAAHPWFEIVADIKTEGGNVERVSSRQRLDTYTHHWRAPDPGQVVPARWDPTHRTLRLELGGDVRYDKKVIKALGRTRDAGFPDQFSGAGG